MLFESLLIPPLDKCMSRVTRKFVRRVLDRAEVAEYQRHHPMRKAAEVSPCGFQADPLPKAVHEDNARRDEQEPKHQ
jgi:hypothetical protein